MSEGETPSEKLAMHKYHRFLDEAGDTTFYGKGKIPAIGNDGVSTHFLLVKNWDVNRSGHKKSPSSH